MDAAESIAQVCNIVAGEHQAARKWDHRADELFRSICTVRLPQAAYVSSSDRHQATETDCAQVLEPSQDRRDARTKALFNVSLVLEGPGQEVAYETGNMAVEAECDLQVCYTHFLPACSL